MISPRDFTHGRWRLLAIIAGAACPGVSAARAAVPVYDHVVIVVEENHSYQQITSTYASSAPYINNTLRAQGASFTNAFAEEHHSEGNYLWLFSGSNHNIGYDDPCPVGPFATPNLGSSLISAGHSFKGYSEDLPSIGSTVCTYGAYARKHNPWVNFSNIPNGSTVATSSNLRYSDFPAEGNYDQLPTVALVVPNQNNDMHNGGDPLSIATGDAWLHNHLDSYYQWAKTHNSLLIVTFDEDQGSTTGLTNPATGANHVVTLFAGAGIAPGSYAKKLTHVNVLRTLEDMFALPHSGNQQSLATAAGFSNEALESNFYVQWIGSGDGAWADSSNWNGGIVPAGAGAVANLFTSGGERHVIGLGSAVTLGVVNIDSWQTPYRLDGAALSLDAPTGSRTGLTVRSGAHEITAPLMLLKDLRVQIDAGASLRTSNLQDASIAISKSGAGTLDVNRVRAAGLTIEAGTIAILANGSSAATSRVASVQLAGGMAPVATFDLADNDLIVTDGDAATVQAQINFARHAGAWDQPGLTSAAAARDSNHASTLALLTSDDYKRVNGPAFDGFDVNDSDLLVKYTWYGDTDFNGVVNFDDYVRTDSGFNNLLTGWVNGDFDGTGVVNFDDYVLIDLAFNVQSGTLQRALALLDGSNGDLAGMGNPALLRVRRHREQFGDVFTRHFLAAAPEPASSLSLAVMSATCATRRRRNRW